MMFRSSIFGVLAAPLLACALTVIHAAPLTVKPGVQVSSVSVYPDFWAYGYLDHRYLVENTTPKRLTVTLTLPEERYGGGLQSLSRTIVLDPYAKVRVSLPQPPLDMSGDRQLSVRVHGGGHESQTLGQFPGLASSYELSNGGYGLLVSRSLSAEVLTTEFTRPAGPASVYTNAGPAVAMPAVSHRHGSSNPKRFTRPEFDVEAWSPDWRAYTPFAGVVLAGRDWPRVPADVREALFAYVRIGGSLAFSGPPDPSDTFPFSIPPSPTGIRQAALGMGTLWIVDEPDPARWPRAAYTYLDHTFTTIDGPLQQRVAFTAAHKACPVVAGIGVPARSFFLTLLGFTVLAGPGVMLYTRRRNNRLMRFILIPALSLVTTGGILLFPLLHDGWTASVRLESVTWLDAAAKRAATVGTVGLYAPFTPSGGLQFQTETEITPLMEFMNEYRAPKCTLDWSRNQHLDSGWIRPRIPVYFQVRRSEKRPERLVVARAGDGLEAVNALGAPIQSLSLRDPDGRLLRAGRIPAGGRAALEVVPQNEIVPGPLAGAKLAESMTRRESNWGMDAIWFNPSNSPVPETGRFIARLESTPFIENPLAGRARIQSRAVVVGTFEIEAVSDQGGRP